jgi:hypothetical protein
MISHNYPLAAYHASPAISGSKVKARDEMRCLADYHARFIARTIPQPEPTEALQIGQLFEDLIQRPEEYEAGLACCNFGAKRADTIASRQREKDTLIRSMVDARSEHTTAKACALHGIPQVTFSVTVKGVALQCRPDWWLPNGLDGASLPCWVDEKSCMDLRWFDEDLVKFRYHWSAWLNRFIITEALKLEHGAAPERVDGWFLATDKPEHYQPMTQAVQLTDAHYQTAQADLEGTDQKRGVLMELIEAYAKNEWPSVEPVVTAKAPRWMERSVQP